MKRSTNTSAGAAYEVLGRNKAKTDFRNYHPAPYTDVNQSRYKKTKLIGHKPRMTAGNTNGLNLRIITSTPRLL